MALDERYVLLQDPESTFVDKDTGLPLSNGKIYFYRDNQRNIPKAVYELTGSPPNYSYIALPNPLILNAVGTPQNASNENVAVYYFPYIEDGEPDAGDLDLYFMDVYSEDDVPQFTRQAWPNTTQNSDPSDNPGLVENELSNAQFSISNLGNESATTYTVTAATNQEFEFAPNWFFQISGTGTVVVQQVALDGLPNNVTTPAYYVDITVSANITSCKLIQRMYHNSGLWANLYLAGFFVGRQIGGSGGSVTLNYKEPTANAVQILTSASLQPEFLAFTSAPVLISPSTDAITSDTSYVDIYLDIGASLHVQLTSVQIAPTTQGNTLPYDQRSSNRELALMGDYYIPRLAEKPIPSLLTGWDFTVNPFQFGLSGNIGATGSYICDQTIAARGSTGNVAFAVSSVTNALQLTTAGTNDAFYILQYLTGDQAKKMIGTRLSSNVFAYKGSVGDDVTMRIYLFRATAAAAIPALGSTIVTLSSSGEVTITAAGWTQIPRSGLAKPVVVTLNTVATNPDVNSPDNDYGFSGWEITDSSEIADTDKFAILVSFAYVTAATVITVNSVSLVPGDIPCRPGVQSIAQCLVDCQFYYESSYPPGIPAGSVSSAGITVEQGAEYSGGSAIGYGTAFGMFFNTVKRTNPTLHLYSPGAGTIDFATMNVYTNGVVRNSANTASSNWTISAGQRSFGAIAANATDLVTGVTGVTTRPFSDLFFNFSADARLGIV